MVNRCAHRGNLVCLKRRGHADNLTCVYHAWRYDLEGNLDSVAFRRGIAGKGGMPAELPASRSTASKRCASTPSASSSSARCRRKRRRWRITSAT